MIETAFGKLHMDDYFSFLEDATVSFQGQRESPRHVFRHSETGTQFDVAKCVQASLWTHHFSGSENRPKLHSQDRGVENPRESEWCYR